MYHRQVLRPNVSFRIRNLVLNVARELFVLKEVEDLVENVVPGSWFERVVPSAILECLGRGRTVRSRG